MNASESVPYTRRLGASAAVAALAAAAAVSTPAQAWAAEQPPKSPTSSAYALKAEGLLPVPATPRAVTGDQEKSVAELPPERGAGVQQQVQESLPDGKLKDLLAGGTGTIEASALNAAAPAPGKANASVAKLKALGLLQAKVISATCTAGEGSAKLVNASIAGKELDSSPAPNSTVPVQLDGVAKVNVTLNKQVENDDGSITVTALEVDLGVAGQGEKISVASATCSAAAPTGPDSTGDEEKKEKKEKEQEKEQPGPAPTPTPVEGNLAVTG